MKKVYLLPLFLAYGMQAADDPMGELLSMMLGSLKDRVESLNVVHGQQKNKKNEDLLKNAIKKGDCIQVARYLDERSNKIPDNAIHVSIKAQQKDVLKLLIERGADVNKKYKGKAPLYEATIYPEILDVLLTADALTEVLDEQLGATPLFMASMSGHEDSCQQLLARNASVRARNYNNATPLHAAAIEAGSVAVIKRLIDAGSQINAKDQKGCTPLMISIYHQYQEAALYLIKTGAAVNVQDSDGDTALHFAAGFVPNIVIVKALLASGANIQATNKKKRTPLHVAVRHEKQEILQELITQGADVWAADKDGQWPLERAKTRNAKQLLIDVMKPKTN